MDDNARSWEADYLARGRLWGGSARHLPDLPCGSRILELGCGNGKTLSGLQACRWDIIALDFSRHATRLCRQNAGIFADRIVTADARAIPFKSGSFDAVLAFHIIGHMTVEDRKTVASEIFRVLSPGGVLEFSAFSTRDFRCGHGRQIEEGTFQRGNGILTHYFSPGEAISLFSQMSPVSAKDHQWSMRVRGNDLERSETAGEFIKKL
jgi:ubiquinone/menaquinone biosynthesis C-methylase UbiE